MFVVLNVGNYIFRNGCFVNAQYQSFFATIGGLKKLMEQIAILMVSTAKAWTDCKCTSPRKGSQSRPVFQFILHSGSLRISLCPKGGLDGSFGLPAGCLWGALWINLATLGPQLEILAGLGFRV